jgi:hypothetical protein
MLAIAHWFSKLMELCLLLKVLMDGIGLREEFKETIGKLGKNGLIMLILVLLFFHCHKQPERSLTLRQLNNFSNLKKDFLMVTIISYLDG